jgi:hypothetical protein
VKIQLFIKKKCIALTTITSINQNNNKSQRTKKRV